ncbi:hypothetical protein F5050DRAFT_87102 [Lentinula boryana]|uniref:Uncharacterized protein n=1 Tax=Lentinula boryana TaxID=40481 RepID=A0ABQ8PWC0_9AGAR|nr:hypothetical protein F5050DRAFT_87102 [Lentinula boryana]
MVVESSFKLSHLLSILLFLGFVLGIIAAPLTLEASTAGLQRRQPDRRVVKFMIAKNSKPVQIDMNDDQPWDATVEVGFQIGDGTPYYASRDGQSIVTVDPGPKGSALEIATVNLDEEGIRRFWSEIAMMPYSSKLSFMYAVTNKLKMHNIMQTSLQKYNGKFIDAHIHEVVLFAF